MPLQCNIDAKGKLVRLIMGIAEVSLAIVLIVALGTPKSLGSGMDGRDRFGALWRVRHLRSSGGLVCHAGDGVQDAPLATLSSQGESQAYTSSATGTSVS